MRDAFDAMILNDHYDAVRSAAPARKPRPGKKAETPQSDHSHREALVAGAVAFLFSIGIVLATAGGTPTSGDPAPLRDANTPVSIA